jgi:hypothetical protein
VDEGRVTTMEVLDGFIERVVGMSEKGIQEFSDSGREFHRIRYS